MWYKLYIHYVSYIYVNTIQNKNEKFEVQVWALMAAVQLKWQAVDIGWLLLLWLIGLLELMQITE